VLVISLNPSLAREDVRDRDELGNLHEQQEKRTVAGGRRFDRRRWFCNDHVLIHFAGDTYAFTNQWGLDTEAIIARLLAAFGYPGSGITVCRSERLNNEQG